MQLRGYQSEAVGEVSRSLARGERPLLQIPTGGGKTVVAVAMIQACLSAGGRALFLAPRRELVGQTVEKLVAAGLTPGVIMAGERGSLYSRVQVASIQTLYRRLKAAPSADLVIVDEAHLSIAPSVMQVLEHYRDAQLVGLTATPARGDGRALGALYDRIVTVASVESLTKEGFLCPAIYYSPSKPDLHEVRVRAGDYIPGELARAVDRPQLVGDVVQHWHKLAHGRKTVVFATSIEHSQHLANEFNKSGVKAEHVDAITPKADRDRIFARFRAGQTTILTNCFLASYGFDLPDLSCVVLARPTKSLVLYLQMVGRGLRPAPGKSECLVIDHSGAVAEHGFADEPRCWSLDGDGTVQERDAARRKAEPKEQKARTCKSCSHVFKGSLVCPKCGWQVPRPARNVGSVDGDLIRQNGEALSRQRDVYAELRMYALSRKFRDGWAAHQYREIYGSFPPWAWNNDPLKVPTARTHGMVKYLQIKWSRGRKRGHATG